MSNLISELKQEHADLLSTIERVLKLGVVSREGRTLLLEIKTLLLSHLQREDDALYPALRAAAKQNERLRKLLRGLSDEMQSIGTTVTAFFAANEGETPNPRFGFELGEILGVLRARISKEERLLYSEFEKLG